LSETNESSPGDFVVLLSLAKGKARVRVAFRKRNGKSLTSILFPSTGRGEADEHARK
jgi:hypothetical protein